MVYVPRRNGRPAFLAAVASASQAAPAGKILQFEEPLPTTAIIDEAAEWAELQRLASEVPRG